MNQGEAASDSMERTGELKANTLEIHDVDNNFIKSDMLTDMLYAHLAGAGGSPEDLGRMQQEVQESGGSFDTLAEMRRLYDGDRPGLVEEVMRRVADDVRSRRNLPYTNSRCLFFVGARELIAQKPPVDALRAYMTRGGEEFQAFKLREVLGIDMEREMYSILPLGSTVSKADICIESFHPEDGETGEFLFKWFHNAPEAGVRVKSVLVTDDKAKELIGLEKLGKEKALGFWHRTGRRRSQRLTPEQQLSGSIFEIHSFREIGPFYERLGGSGIALALGGTQDWPLRNRI